MVQRVQAQEGFEGLEEHREALTAYLLKRGVREHEVHDVVQEAFLRGARYRKPDLEGKRLRGWLMRIATNLYTDAARKGLSESHALERRGREHSQVLNAHEGDIPTESEEAALRPWFVGGRWFEGEEVLGALQQAWQCLGEADRVVLRGYYEEQRTQPELAQALGVTIAMVKVRLFRARKRLRACLERGLTTQVSGVSRPGFAW